MLIEDSPFDSAHYGIKIGRIVPDDTADLSPTLATGKERDYAVLFLRVSDASPLVDELAARGITPCETLVTSTLKTPTRHPSRATCTIEQHERVTDPADIDAIAALTGEAIHNTHLHVDPKLPTEKTRALYAAWARNDVTGRAQRTIIARDGGQIVGYITVVIAHETAMIDLVAVTPARQGGGFGGAMLDAFLAWIATTGLGATVGTQSDNRALGLYQRYGFVPTQVQSTYHLWLD